MVTEKLLKAIYVKKTSKALRFSHDLLRLVDKISLKLTDEQMDWLDEISTYNLNARYDNYKQDFQKMCTEEFTLDRINRIKILKLWLIKQL